MLLAPLLTDELSPEGQRASVLSSYDERSLKRAIRLDLLLFGAYVVPDSYVFDGAILSAMGPRRLVDFTGHRPGEHERSLEVRMRARTVKGSLQEFLVNEETGKYNRIAFSSLIDRDLMDRVALALSQTSAPRGSADIRRTTSTAAAAMQDAGAPAQTVQALREGWLEWASFDDRDALGPWPANRKFDLEKQVETRPLNLEAFETQAGIRAYRQLVRRIKEGFTRKSELSAALFDHTPSSNDVERMSLWYQDCRQMTLKEQHRAHLAVRPANYNAFLKATNYADEQGTDAEPATLDDHANRAVSMLAAGLADLSSDQFAQLLADTRSLRRNWIESRGELRSLRQLVMAAHRRIDDPEAREASTRRVVFRTNTSLAGALGVGGLGIGGALAVSAQKFITAGSAAESWSQLAGSSGGVIAASTTLAVIGGVYGRAKLQSSGILPPPGDQNLVVRWASESGRYHAQR